MKTGSLRFPNRRTSVQGMALIMVIWIILVLTIASIGSVKLIYSESEQAAIRIHGSRARLNANMGIAVAANPLIFRDDPLLKKELDGEGYEASLTAEAGKFNINYMIIKRDDELLRNIFTEWGMDFDESNQLIACLYDWVDDDEEVTPGGAEISEYESEGIKNFPFNRAFYSLSELKYVRGWDRVEELNPNWRDWLTIWSQGKLDLNEADPELLALACNSDPEIVRTIRETVIGEDGILGTSDDQRKTSVENVLDSLGLAKDGRQVIESRLTVQDSTTRIESIGKSGDQKRKIVLIIGNRTGVPSLLDRYEEIVP